MLDMLKIQAFDEGFSFVRFVLQVRRLGLGGGYRGAGLRLSR